MKILIIDNDAHTVDLVKNTLQLSWPETELTCADTAARGMKQIESEPFDIVLVDLCVTGMPGFDTLTRIRQKTGVPIIVLCAHDEENNIVKALGLGADDYLAKPFGQLELLARIKALVRRSTNGKESKVSLGNMVLDLNSNQLNIDGSQVRLTKTEKAILKVLMQNPGRFLDTRQIAEAVYGSLPGENNIKTYVYRIRNKIETDPQNPRLLLNDPGLGYCLTADR